MNLSFLNKLNSEITAKFPLLREIETYKGDGTVNRFDSTKQDDKAVWVCVHEWDFKGNFYQKAIFGNWREGIQYNVTSYDKKESQNKEFRATEKKKQIETQEKLDKEKQEKYKSCRDLWGPIYYGLAQESPVHIYLKNKKIASNYHARVTEKDVLLVPAWNGEGIFVGGQRIFLDPETEKFEKRYTYGIEKIGSFCPFGDIRNAEFIYVAEGFATAATIAQAFKNRKNVAVVCVFDTGNILAGAQAVRKINTNCYLIFAADKDTNSDPRWHNIGERKAKQAANRLSNSIVKTVRFSEGNDQWSDYNDLHQFEGIDKVIIQLTAEEADFIDVIPLGFDDSKYYYFFTHKKQIADFTPAGHNPSNFLLNAPSRFWGDRYGYVMKQDGTLSNNPDWKKVIEKLGQASSKAGYYNESKVRGIGAWELNGEVVVNLGDKIYHKEEFFPLYNNGIDEEHFYQSREFVDVDFNKPLGKNDCMKFVEAFQLLNYKNPSDYIIVLGWLFSAQIFAALPWRPHIWFTGRRGCGKSTILRYINESINFSIPVQDATAAGIRQRIKNNALPIVYDETEPETEKARETMAGVLKLAREASTRGNYEVLRGTASGNSISYNTSTTFCMGSIQLSDMGGADTSRFFVIEMNGVENQDPEAFIRLDNAMNDLSGLSSGLFVRATNMYSNHIKNIKTAIAVIKDRKIEARQADQLAPIIAGYYAFFDTGLMPEQFVIDTIKEMNFEQSDYARANEVNDSESCYQDLMEIQIPGRIISVGQILENYCYQQNQSTKDEYDLLLGLIGLRFNHFDKELFISSKSSALKNQMQKFSKYSDYANILKRHDTFVKTATQRVAGKPSKGIVIKYNFGVEN